MAPRLRLRCGRAHARGAWLAAGLWLGLAGAASACTDRPFDQSAMAGSLVLSIAAQEGVVAAWYEAPTTRYPHGVLGDTVEAGTLAVQIHAVPSCITARIVLPEDQVFEDLAPRLADLNSDGIAEVVVVQSDARLGGKLAVYGLTPDGTDLTPYAATPNIGRSNRWLAPIGIADLDGDGAIEIAYIDRPHLARTLRIWRFAATGLAMGDLTEIAAAPGFTNHRIGEDFISSGLRDCGAGPEMITANEDWSRVMATRLTQDGQIATRALGPWSQSALADALACQD